MTEPLFRDHKPNAPDWITSQARPFYPDYLVDALVLYKDIFARFLLLAEESGTTPDLFRRIQAELGPSRIQLLRVFRKCASPQTSVEMLKVKAKTEAVIKKFGPSFRGIDLIRERLKARTHPDEALAAVFWEHHDRGTPGYVLSAQFFDFFEERFGEDYVIIGPREAGSDVLLQEVLEKFEKIVPADFMISRRSDRTPLVVGFAHYDSDRGGSQEDDRTGGNQDKVEKVMTYAARRRMALRVLFINDGPGLLLGSMWNDYGRLETDNIVDDELRVMVATMKMIPERLTPEWMEGTD